MMSRNSSRNCLDNQCQECGCHCDSCVNNNSIHLHQEIESLKERLKEREKQIVTMECQILSHAKQYPNGEMQALRDNIYHWNDKYNRLLENYRRLQKVNQGLEDKLLRVADCFETERIHMNQNNEQLTQRLDEANASLMLVKQQNQQYLNDYDLIIRMIQQQPSTMINIESFPNDFQSRYQKHLNNHNQNGNVKTVNHRHVQIIPTFPPTAIYSFNDDDDEQQQINGSGDDTNNQPPDSSNILSPAQAIRLSQILAKQQQNICSNCKTNMDNQPELIRPPPEQNMTIGNYNSFIMEMSNSGSKTSSFIDDNNRTIII
ncbi:hypothetical protein HUG17_9537 [Dermatophagoides farinae]|uniref:Uncharacterized protein n=1 Tax=Dermatophagoides farinae TaxID=6954 RepID=A0A9D4SIM5_DERFA|nr:brain-enriched guanylate kinase-associated protein-like [Dermatophagoides farinae]KAH7642846.1 hypothetical protein HUG17_9537 [Dermatophagoides farinae]